MCFLYRSLFLFWSPVSLDIRCTKMKTTHSIGRFRDAPNATSCFSEDVQLMIKIVTLSIDSKKFSNKVMAVFLRSMFLFIWGDGPLKMPNGIWGKKASYNLKIQKNESEDLPLIDLTTHKTCRTISNTSTFRFPSGTFECHQQMSIRKRTKKKETYRPPVCCSPH